MPIISCWALSCHRPPSSRVTCSRTAPQTVSESISTPSRSKMTAARGIATCSLARPLEADPELMAFDRHSRPGDRAVIADRGRERLTGQIVLVGACGVQELGVAPQCELDSIRDLEAGIPARVLD